MVRSSWLYLARVGLVGEAVRAQPHVPPCYRPCPHTHTPYPTEQALSDSRHRHTVTAHKGTHNWASRHSHRPGSHSRWQTDPSQAICPGLGERVCPAEVNPKRGCSLMNSTWDLPPLLSYKSFWKSSSAGSAEGPALPRQWELSDLIILRRKMKTARIVSAPRRYQSWPLSRSFTYVVERGLPVCSM